MATLMATGAQACLVMHTSIDDTAEALSLIKSNWAGPIGAYPEAGHFEMPNWVFDALSPADFVEHCRRWRRMGATLFGGCCGIGPEHIAALSTTIRTRTMSVDTYSGLPVRRGWLRGPGKPPPGGRLPLHAVPQADRNLYVGHRLQRRRADIDPR